MTLHVCEHPIVEHKLTRLRDEDSPPALFRHLTNEITQVLIVEATADLEPARIQTSANTVPASRCTHPAAERGTPVA